MARASSATALWFYLMLATVGAGIGVLLYPHSVTGPLVGAAVLVGFGAWVRGALRGDGPE